MAIYSLKFGKIVGFTARWRWKDVTNDNDKDSDEILDEQSLLSRFGQFFSDFYTNNFKEFVCFRYLVENGGFCLDLEYSSK